MPVDASERGFEEAIEDHLLTQAGYLKGDPTDFDADFGLFPAPLVAFLKDSQPDEWERLTSIYGSGVEGQVVGNLVRNLDQRGMLDCIRHGISDRGVKLRLAYFKPASGLNPETLKLYGKNVLAVTRQVHYNPKKPDESIDVVLSLNGLPLATAELKQPFKRQNFRHAINQYKNDRDPNAPILKFKQRALVHFAVDPDEIYMTTRLAGRDTYFLPFNRGRDGGAGNPDHPSGWRTAYLWEDVWVRDSWLDIVSRFLHVEVREDIKNGKKTRKESLIFPRFHQLESVRRLIDAARTDGAGTNYLVQHSAGSGKSNSIAWLCHRLANLHDAQDRLIFDSIVVVTDRIVLDKQLQDTIYQFEHRQGVVVPIDEHSKQLGEALMSGAKIIITTLQKFPFAELIDGMDKLPNRNYAVVVDEAHSSQTGESAKNLKEVLAASNLEDADQQEGEHDPTQEDSESEILKVIDARGPQSNLSFFAFTATPKHKTLELFGHPGPDRKPAPFHLYSMRQAVEERFILDVLKHFTTYKTCYELAKIIEEDPQYDRKALVLALARHVSLHPHNLKAKTAIMVEHFRQSTRCKIGGKAKAMVVTRSRLHAVRYRQAFDDYLREKGYNRLKALVAFSGTVRDENGLDYTEAGMNGFGEKQLPRKFDTDEFHFLIVAEKYQTGFDQPLLHTMYVDKKLQGLQAVQTLSRLNRILRGKEDTFVLDFVNEVQEIQDAFKPYYETTEIDERVDPNLIYTLKHKLDAFQIYWHQEVEDFSKVFFKPLAEQQEADKGRLHQFVNPAVERFEGEPEERQADFRHNLGSYCRLYAFVSQMVNFKDVDLEKLNAYGRLLLSKLPRDPSIRVDIDDEVALAFYRNDRTFEGSASLATGTGATVSGPTQVGTGRPKEEDIVKLSDIVDVLNQRFGTDFSKQDQLLFDQVIGDLTEDEVLGHQARNNPIDQFKHAFDPKAMDAFVKRMDRNEKVGNKFMSDEALRQTALALMMQTVFERFQDTG